MLRRLILGAMVACCPVEAGAQEVFKSIQNWGGLRDRLADKGLSFDIVYTGEFMANTRGGLKEGETYLSNLDLAMTIETAKAGWWENGKFFVYGLVNHDEGKPTADFIGDRNVLTNIEATRTARLYEFWYEHEISEERLSFLLGLHDYNSEFDVTEYGGLFINSAFGIQTDIAANGRPSVFPLTAPGVRFKWTPREDWGFLLGVYDGNPGDPGEARHSSRWDFSNDDGAFIAEEVTRRHHMAELPGTLKLGSWQNTGDFDDVLAVDGNGDPVVHDGNYGIYAVADQLIYREQDEQGLGVFMQAGGAPEDRNVISFYWGAGLNYQGLIPGRDRDQAGFAVARAYISDDFRKGQPSDASETVLEWTYRAHICDNFALQPDVQYVIDPGANPDADNALAAILRFEIVL